MAKYFYRIEYRGAGSPDPDDWKTLPPYRDVPKTWAEGWLAHHREAPGPRLAYRLVRSDGKVIETIPGIEEVSIGMVAGWPSWQQYAHAAAKALQRASQIASRGHREDVDEAAAQTLLDHASAIQQLLQEDR